MIRNLKEAERFDLWLRDKVQSVHYSNNKSMTNAFTKIEALKFNPLN